MNFNHLLACARAAHETQRSYRISKNTISGGPTEELPHWEQTSDREATMRCATDVLEGVTPTAEESAHIENGALFVSSVRCMGAVLGMTVIYPGDDSQPTKTVDWSNPPRRA